jgi:hypothetical protein
MRYHIVTLSTMICPRDSHLNRSVKKQAVPREIQMICITYIGSVQAEELSKEKKKVHLSNANTILEL